MSPSMIISDVEMPNVSRIETLPDEDNHFTGIHAYSCSVESRTSTTEVGGGTSSSPPQSIEADITNDEHTHKKLQRQIEVLRKKYKKKKTVLTDNNASSRMLDLEAISQYNDLRFKLINEQRVLKSRLKNCPRITQQRLRKRITRISPSTDASISVARRLGKSSYYARVLRSMTNELFRTGQLPESRQGKGATHKSYLLNPRVTSALRNWVKGLLPDDEGGFIGLVRFYLFIIILSILIDQYMCR